MNTYVLLQDKLEQIKNKDNITMKLLTINACITYALTAQLSDNRTLY